MSDSGTNDSCKKSLSTLKQSALKIHFKMQPSLSVSLSPVRKPITTVFVLKLYQNKNVV